MTYVFESAPTETAAERAVLLAIADNCNDKGCRVVPERANDCAQTSSDGARDLRPPLNTDAG